jgi:hypothetical protein
MGKRDEIMGAFARRRSNGCLCEKEKNTQPQGWPRR